MFQHLMESLARTVEMVREDQTLIMVLKNLMFTVAFNISIRTAAFLVA